MRLLLIKTSSMGDVIHTFPAITDALKAKPDLQIDWLVEEAFVGLARLHPKVQNVIPFSLRRWKKTGVKSLFNGEVSNFIKTLRKTEYDMVLDAQGLIKSALPTRLAKANVRKGLDKNSIREPFASFAYQEKISVSKRQHAIQRLRKLFARSIGYSLPVSSVDYGLSLRPDVSSEFPSVWFIHGTSWKSKHWPEEYWIEASRFAKADGYEVKLPWGSHAERERAERIVAKSNYGEVLPQLPLDELAKQMANASLTIGMDTGLSHLAAALDIPSVVIYGSTSSTLTGVLGDRTQALQMDYTCAPCLKRECFQSFENDQRPCYLTVEPETIWNKAKAL